MTGNSKDVKQLSRSPYHLLKRAAQYAAHIYMGEVGKSGLTQRQFTVLLAVDQNDGISQTALVKMTGIDRSTLADLVARLLAQGYLQRRRTKDDGAHQFDPHHHRRQDGAQSCLSLAPMKSTSRSSR